ncbi:MAG: zinc-dependent dehydrogenase [Planctomycetota bacterium]|jgi:L-iditol 2-dehydrogenase
MKAAVYYKNSDVRLEERPQPTAGPGEILLRVRASSICGSDIMEWYRIKKAPIVLGHEIAGDVVEVGEGVTRYKVGDRVAANHHVPCNTCRYCLDDKKTCCETLHTTGFDPGGFSEFVRVPPLQTERGVYPLPDSMSYDEGSFVEPLACVRRGQRIAGVRPTKTVLVLGAGISGAMHIALARATGCARILATDIHPWRLENAKSLGACAVTDAREDVPAWVREHNEGRGADIIFVCAGAKSALEQGLASVDRGGTVMFFAVPGPGTELAVPVNDFWRNGITLLPSYANDARDAMEAIDLITSGAVPAADMITHRLPLDEAQEGFRLTAAGGESLKVVLVP